MAQGSCSYCGSADRPLITPADLNEHFSPLLDLYEPTDAPEGQRLDHLIYQEWGIFSFKTCQQLLAAIAPEFDVTNRRYASRESPQSHRVQQWDRFKEELLHRNRFFPQAELDWERILWLLAKLVVADQDNQGPVFRCRINSPGRAFDPREMLNPPPDQAVAGRGNPEGISYFYAASDIATAISEVRPQIDEIVTVAEFRFTSPPQLVDLRNPNHTFTPFGHEDETNLDEIRNVDLPLLAHFGRQLSRPIHSHRSRLDYLPTQYLSERIKNAGYHGIVFKSSMSSNLSGFNYLLFTSDALSRVVQHEYRVTRISLDYEQVEQLG